MSESSTPDNIIENRQGFSLNLVDTLHQHVVMLNYQLSNKVSICSLFEFMKYLHIVDNCCNSLNLISVGFLVMLSADRLYLTTTISK